MGEEIKIGEEFLLYECTDSLHSEEKVYMTINDIRKDDYNGELREGMLSIVMYFDLRYEGDEPIELVNKGDDISTFDVNFGTGSFSDLCSFQTKISTKSLKDLTHAVAVSGMGYDSIPLEDMDIELETYIKMNHEGKEIREKIF